VNGFENDVHTLGGGFGPGMPLVTVDIRVNRHKTGVGAGEIVCLMSVNLIPQVQNCLHGGPLHYQV
jgi:hypothetical protein